MSKEQIKNRLGSKFYNDFDSTIKSAQSLIYLNSFEENRALDFLKDYSNANGYDIKFWDVYQKLRNNLEDYNNPDLNNDTLSIDDIDNPIKILDEIIARIKTKEEKTVSLYVLIDFHRFLENCIPDIERRIKYISSNNNHTVIIFLCPHFISTPSIEKEIKIFDLPSPSSFEIEDIIDQVVSSVSIKIPSLKEKVKSKKTDIINSVKGLTHNEIFSVLKKSICAEKDINIPILISEKKNIIKKTGILEFIESDVSADQVGGLDTLINYIKNRKSAFSDDAKKYGINVPKGIFLCGISGGGKSLTAKAAASILNFPLIRLDFGAIFNAHVGESERAVRTLTNLANNLAPMVLWIDEVEKGISGSKSSGSTDSGVTARVVGTLLTWLQEKTEPVYVVCTANDPSSIPTEFLRAGRFDEIFFIDIPSEDQRKDILAKIITKKKRNPKNYDLAKIAKLLNNYTGAEIEKAIDSAMLIGFSNNREFDDLDIVEASKTIKTIAMIRASSIKEMRAWAKEKCLFANTKEETTKNENLTIEL